MRNAEIILENEQKANLDYTYDAALIRFGALMHDVGDKKYALPGVCHGFVMRSLPKGPFLTAMLGENVERMVYDMIMSTFTWGNVSEYHAFAKSVQAIASGVSYTSELAHPGKVEDLIKQIPELAIVQVCLPRFPRSSRLTTTHHHNRTPTASTQSAQPALGARTCTVGPMICHCRRRGRS